MKGKSKLRKLRIILAAIVLVAFILLFADFAGVFHDYLGFLPKLEFWTAVMAHSAFLVLMWVLFTFLFGRVYCSIACPLGILQDFIYRIRTAGKKKKKYQQKYVKEHRFLRYGVFAAFMVAVLFGGGAIACLVEPYSIFGRMMTSPFQKSVPILIISCVTLAVIVIMVIKTGRGWCNNICPVGTILGTVSRFSRFKPVIDTGSCVSCGLCGKACRAQCIDTKNHKVDTSRCIMCLDCLDNCHEGAIRLKYAGKRHKVEPDSSEPTGRRAFLSATALVLGSAVAKASEGHGGLITLEKKKTPRREVPLVPAGSLSLKHLRNHCVACQLCVQACPNHVLRPSMDSDHFMQPVMDFSVGSCRTECTVCSDVCPAHAIGPVTPEQKSSISVGHAVFDVDACVVVTDKVKCGNCARHCPVGAISMVKQQGSDADSQLRIPFVRTERCIGCGRCENVCPSRPYSAIHVEGNEVHRVI